MKKVKTFIAKGLTEKDFMDNISAAEKFQSKHIETAQVIEADQHMYKIVIAY